MSGECCVILSVAQSAHHSYVPLAVAVLPIAAARCPGFKLGSCLRSTPDPFPPSIAPHPSHTQDPHLLPLLAGSQQYLSWPLHVALGQSWAHAGSPSLPPLLSNCPIPCLPPPQAQAPARAFWGRPTHTRSLCFIPDPLPNHYRRSNHAPEQRNNHCPLRFRIGKQIPGRLQAMERKRGVLL